MATVGDRLEEVMRDLGGISANELGRRATKAADGKVMPGQTITHMIRESRRNPDYSPDTSTLLRIAEGTGYSYAWLASGEGTRHARPATSGIDPFIPPTTTFDAKELVRKARKIARRDGLDIEDYAWEEFERIAPTLRGGSHGGRRNRVGRLPLEARYRQAPHAHGADGAAAGRDGEAGGVTTADGPPKS